MPSIITFCTCRTSPSVTNSRRTSPDHRAIYYSMVPTHNTSTRTPTATRTPRGGVSVPVAGSYTHCARMSCRYRNNDWVCTCVGVFVVIIIILCIMHGKGSPCYQSVFTHAEQTSACRTRVYNIILYILQ